MSIILPTVRRPLNTILVKPAGPDCNMACEYCFYLSKSELFTDKYRHRMSDDTLREMIRQMMTLGTRELSFGWQGGEPTLMGLPFFRKAVEYQQRFGRGQLVNNALQTNGILIDKKWVEFFREYNALVGLSLDGPRHVHDHYRRLVSGKGTWSKVIDRAKMMLDAGVAVNVLSVVNDYSAGFPEEIYEFHKNHGLDHMQFIPCVETDPYNLAKAAAFSVTAEQYGEFLVRMFDLWMADFKNGVPTTSIRMFESIFHTYVGFPSPECTFLDECGVYLVVEHNGDVFSCDFYVEPEWKLGNLMEGNLAEMLNSPRQGEFAQLKSNLPGECRSCKWLAHCRGGCTKDRQRDPRDKGLNHFCRSYRMFFAHADERLKQMAVEWKSRQR